tara:strand:+ start:251 stop:682 length:432 start_codon:yes stop_codon:yes gene_type:complete
MTLTKQERLNDILDKHVFQRANEIHPFLAENHGEAYSDCWSNMFYDEEQIIDLLLDGDAYDAASEDVKEFLVQEVRDNGKDYQEIFEYWLVSDWLYDQLERSGAPVLEFKGLYFWGRTETGQCLTLDYYLNRVNNRLHTKLAA